MPTISLQTSRDHVDSTCLYKNLLMQSAVYYNRVTISVTLG